MLHSQPHPAVRAAALYLTAIPIGRQGIAFDRLELDAWVADYVSRNGRPAARRNKPWDE
jgi:hypothetical protein